MILSFNPVILGEENINCAGRPPGKKEIEAVRRAAAVFVPQGIREDLYRLCRAACPLVWPNYDLRFSYPGKVGQSLLFSRFDLHRPRTVVFPSIRDFNRSKGGGLPRPYVLKTNLGGEGRGVYLVRTKADETAALKAVAQSGGPGGGFIQQEFIDHGGRDLRVVVIGDRISAYWRLAPKGEKFLTNLSVGGTADFHSDPELMEAGIAAVREFSERAGVDLAGFDLLFDSAVKAPQPLFLEINWYFGRKALGGSEDYYKVLKRSASGWLKKHGLKRGPVRSRPRYGQRD